MFLDVSLAHANVIAGIAGVSCSFFGSKYFVFNRPQGNMQYQAVKFIVIYICTIIIHTLILTWLSNAYGLDYRISFVIASFFVMTITFLSNKFMVFN